MELHACALEAQAKAIIHYTTSAGVPKDKVLDSLEDVANAVLAAQNDIAGSNTGIIDGLIRLEIHNVGTPVQPSPSNYDSQTPALTVQVLVMPITPRQCLKCRS